jgi:hypothetical protein
MDSCPWDKLRPATVKYNESNVNAWIRQPANAWSNLAYIVVGLWLYARFGIETRHMLWMIPLTAILIGVTSFLYHASFTLLFQTSDLVSMYLFSCLLIVLDVKTLARIGDSAFYGLYLALVLASSVLFLRIKAKAGIVIFIVHVLVIIVLQIMIGIGGQTTIGYTSFAWMLVTLLLAFSLWLLDLKGTLFHPDNHLVQGHALWHLASSLCFIFVYNHYAQ